MLRPNAPQKMNSVLKPLQEAINCDRNELSIYLQALAAGYLPTYLQDIKSSRPSKLISIASKSFVNGKKTAVSPGFRFLTMLKLSTENLGKESRISSQAVSLVKTSVRRAAAQESPEKTPGCGPKWRESSAKYDRNTRSWKTPQCSLFADFIGYSETFPKWGTMRNGELFPQQMPAQLTKGNVCGLWPTPVKNEERAENYTKETSYRHFITKSNQVHLAQIVRDKRMFPTATRKGIDGGSGSRGAAKRRGMWPTPLAQLCGTSPGNLQGAIDGKFHMTLDRAVKIWPTPTVGDTWNSEKSVEQGVKKKHLNAFVKKYPTPKVDDAHNVNPKSNRFEGLVSRVNAMKKYPTPTKCDSWAGNLKVGFDAPTTLSQSFQTEGQLNPDWVEWLMGWPVGQSSLEPIDKNVFLKWIDDVSNGAYWLTDPADDGSIPRTSIEIKNRADRLSAIGNGQVPATAALAWKILNERMLTNA